MTTLWTALVWIADGSGGGNGDGRVPIFTHQIQHLLSRIGSRFHGFFPPRRGLDEDSPPQSPQYEELVEVVTQAVSKLNIEWPTEKQAELKKSKLDERFLWSKLPPARQSLPFFPNLHTDVSRLWAQPFLARIYNPGSSHYANVVGLNDHGYRTIPRVQQTFASYLSDRAGEGLLPCGEVRTNC